jgi:Domain of unknown function (DUF4920)
MKNLFILSVLIVSAIAVMGQPPTGKAKKGMIFGEKTTADGAITVNQLTRLVSEDKPLDVKVEGRVMDVCTKEGCWLKLEMAQGGTMMVKMKDHAFLVPVSLNGKEVVVDAVAKLNVTSVAELQHYAEDAGKSKEAIAAITEPKKEIVLTAKGILVM